MTFMPGCTACSVSQHVASSASYAAAAPFCGCQKRPEFGSVQIATSWIEGYLRTTLAMKPQNAARDPSSSGGELGCPVTASTIRTRRDALPTRCSSVRSVSVGNVSPTV
jgi:hypothetical protein